MLNLTWHLHDFGRQRLQLPRHDSGQQAAQQLPKSPCPLKAWHHVRPQLRIVLQPQAHIHCRLCSGCTRLTGAACRNTPDAAIHRWQPSDAPRPCPLEPRHTSAHSCEFALKR